MNDETLSAFLDGELPAGEIAAVREAVARDAVVGQRLAALAMADGLVRKQARALDDQPMPEAVLRMLRDEAPAARGKVVSLNARRGAWRMTAMPAALAASLALVIGFVAGQFTRGPDGGLPNLAVYAPALDATLSGEAASIGDGARLLSRFSFRDRDGRYCRQYQLQSGQSVSENVACRTGGEWIVLASVQLPAPETGAYLPASGPELLDAILDPLMQGQPLSLREEERLVQEQWVDNGGQD